MEPPSIHSHHLVPAGIIRTLSRMMQVLLILACCRTVLANIPGGGDGTGPDITLTSDSTTTTLANGVVSIQITRSNAQITRINYTFDNSGSSQTLNLLSGNPNGGKLYWEHSNNQGLVFTNYTVVADPATNGGDYAEVSLYSTTQAAMPFAVHYSMRRGSPGFYVTAIWTHGSTDGAFSMGECRNNIYAGSIFNWMSVDATRNKLMQVSGGTSISVPTAPVECSLWTNGIYQGCYEDKYKYSAHWGDQRVWGWSSVGSNGKNVGLWNVSATSEYYNGGPLHAELMCHIGTTILNMFNGNHYEMGTDGKFVAGETWGKVCGPYFVYCNHVPKAVTDTVQASQALYQDALEQGAAEASAWPYSWFSNPSYAGPGQRGTVTGKIVMNDIYNPNATASNLWVGLIRQPQTSSNTYDFQQWMKPYQFWVHTDDGGNFTIPAVIAGSGYTLYAFGQGANGTFMSQAQTGGSPPFLADIPALPFDVTVAGGATTALGEVTWTPARVGPTVFEIGYPDRTGRKFRHGEDWWVGDIGPSPAVPSPVWSKWLEFPVDFPDGPNYVVGTHRWSTDWNFVQPVVYSPTGTWNSSSSTITFNLASAPLNGELASIYLGLASDYYTALIMTVNGTNLASAPGLVATPSSLPSTGFVPTSSRSNSTLREGINGAFSDERITFAAGLLKAGTNTIKISQRQVGGTYFANHAMYDYIRLELTQHVPPAPAGVTAFAGNNRVLVTWPVVPGATSYTILRSAGNGSGFTPVATGVTGPVSGSGPTHAGFIDTTALNGTNYSYSVLSTNPVDSSAASPASAGVTPSSDAPVAAPDEPTGLTATAGAGSVVLNWSAAAGADTYTVKRSTLTYNGGGTTIPLNTIILANSISNATYADDSVTHGSLYSYTVSATNAAGTGADSGAVSVTPQEIAPTAAPADFTASIPPNPNVDRAILGWSAVPGALGYVIRRSASATGNDILLATVSSLTFTDYNLTANTTWYYKIAAMTSGGTSTFVSTSVTTPPAAPANLVATPGGSKITLNWSQTAGATSYVMRRSTVSGGPYSTLATAIQASSYTDTTGINGVMYYYVVAATGAGGIGNESTEATATATGSTTLVWNGDVNSDWDRVTPNWRNGAQASTFADGVSVIFDETAANRTVSISGAVSPDSLLFDGAGDYMFSANALSGSTGLTKLGTGNLGISGINTFSGGTMIGGGAVLIGGGSENGQNGLGGGGITLRRGTLGMNGFNGSSGPYYGVLANPIEIPAASTGTLRVSQRGGQSGPVTGSGTLALQVNYVRGDISGDWSAFTGQINVVRTRGGANVDNFRINSTAGFGAAAINLGPYVQASTPLNANNSFTIGELSGDAESQLAGIIYNNNTPGNFVATYIVGGRGTDATFSGAITNGAGPSRTAITKVGRGTWTLAGNNTYSGTTVVSGGTLNLTGSVVGSESITVENEATLVVTGGTLSISGSVTNNGVVRLTGVSMIANAGNFTNNGVLDLINGPQGLPANFVNNGTVLDSGSVKVNDIRISETDVSVSIQSFVGHHYQMQGSDSLDPAAWQDIGGSRAGDGGMLTFIEGGGRAAVHRFYRIVVSP